MSKAVVYRGAEPTDNAEGFAVGEWDGDEEVADVTITAGLTEIKEAAFNRCKGLNNLRFLTGSGITTIGRYAFAMTRIITLQGVEGARKLGNFAFFACKDLRTIEGLGCEEMGQGCFAWCTLLKSMKGWPASMTVIPTGCFERCTDMTTVDCDLSHVTSIGMNAFAFCTSLLPPSLSEAGADPAAVLAYLKRKSFLERAPERRAFLCSLKHAQSDYYNRTGDPCGASRRIIVEFAGLFDNAAVLAYWEERASNEREAAQAAELEIKNVRVAEELEIENARVAEELEIKNAARAAELESAARAAEDSLLAELDAEDAAKKGGKKKKKKKKKKASGKKEAQQAEPADWRTDFQRYVQSDMMRGVDERKRQRNLEEAAKIMAAHEQKIAALGLPPSPVAPPAAPDALAETAEDIEAQIAALGLPPDFDPAPPPAAAPDAFLESLLAAPPPPPPPAKSLKETVAELHTLMFGAEPPPGATLLAVLEKLEGEFGYVGTGTAVERISILKEQVGV
ncbi:hypothetical protein TeGR_g13289 [Tetraparma gracilis]|uniref:Uncharacterized protein n=1 Tax=Tetraparma gracilis TaxID=2962635 RepID=A0ABQ6MBJ5_9STRA|nr:hypothetical protein TeGR_g13289 [Tetraparma gracilis]